MAKQQRIPRPTSKAISMFDAFRVAKFDTELANLRQQAKAGKSVTLYRGHKTRSDMDGSFRRVGKVRRGTSWTTDPAAALAHAYPSKFGPTSLIYSVKVPASEVKEVLRRQKIDKALKANRMGQRRTRSAAGQWEVGRDNDGKSGFIEFRPGRDRPDLGRPTVAFSARFQDGEVLVSGGSKGKLSAKGGGGGGGRLMAKRLPRGTIPRSAFTGDRKLWRGLTPDRENYRDRSRVHDQLKRRLGRQDTIRLYRGVGTRHKTLETVTRERGIRAGSSWTTSIGAARRFAASPGSHMDRSRAGMIYAVDVPAAPIRESLKKMRGGGRASMEHSVHWRDAKKTGAAWSIGGDLEYGFLELRPNKDMNGRPLIVQTATRDGNTMKYSRVNHEGWFQAGGAKGKLGKAGGGGGGG